MRSLEEIDPLLLDQVIRRLLAKPRAKDREPAIAAHLQQSGELKEWIEMCAHAAAPLATQMQLSLNEAHQVQLYIAFALGLEVGYLCCEREMER